MFYDNLKKECERQGLKVTPVVLECGGNKGSLSGWKKGASPNSDIVMKLSVRLNVPTDYLLFGESKTKYPTLTEYETQMLEYFRNIPKEEQLKELGRLSVLAEKNEAIKNKDAI